MKSGNRIKLDGVDKFKNQPFWFPIAYLFSRWNPFRWIFPRWMHSCIFPPAKRILWLKWSAFVMQVTNSIHSKRLSLLQSIHSFLRSHFTLLYFSLWVIMFRCCYSYGCCFCFCWLTEFGFCIQLNLHYGYLCRFQCCVTTINVIVCQLDVYILCVCVHLDSLLFIWPCE